MYAASFSPNEHFLVSGCSQGLLLLWNVCGDGGDEDAHTNKPVATMENAHDLGVTCMAFAPAMVNGKFYTGSQL